LQADAIVVKDASKRNQAGMRLIPNLTYLKEKMHHLIHLLIF